VSSALLALLVTTVSALQWTGTLQFTYQRILIRFMQPMMISGLTMLGYYCITGAGDLIVLPVALVLAGAAAFGLYRMSRRVEKQLAKIVPEEAMDDAVDMEIRKHLTSWRPPGQRCRSASHSDSVGAGSKGSAIPACKISETETGFGVSYNLISGEVYGHKNATKASKNIIRNDSSDDSSVDSIMSSDSYQQCEDLHLPRPLDTTGFEHSPSAMRAARTQRLCRLYRDLLVIPESEASTPYLGDC
jgi:hypothetical protein